MTTHTPLSVVVAGLGNMGRSHALAYATNPGFRVAALVNRSDVPLPGPLAGTDIRRSFEDAIRDVARAFQNHLLPASFDEDGYYNVRTMKKLGAK